MSYSEVKNLPVNYRRWFLKRLTREFEEAANRMKSNKPQEKENNLSKLDQFEKNMFKNLKK